MSWKLDNGQIQLTNLSHVGIAVRDAEATAVLLSKTWNIGQPEVFDYRPTADEMISGEPFGVRLVFIKFGPLTLELLQPLDDKSIWSEFIAEKGEGIHHIALGVSNYDEMVETFKAQGHPMLVGAVFNGCRWCYFDTSPGGTVIEFREEYPR
ncbi:MAG: methylmalonyl-CoA epimerase family protein [Acidimicrobiaceae bacterium]|nr:methylmalonyl-CoA epimerase family protein [Acidimicrobiaceae bacterium]